MRNDVIPPHVLGIMQNSMRHRGPDGEGDFHAPGFGMGVRRLSIIDLQTGNQPIYNEDRTLVLICNGEIYNFVELRNTLESDGHRFATRSDCETILHLYENYGTDCVHFLRGMFAFALFDISRRRLFLARDRMGEKPLYLYRDDHQFLFGSELKTLLSTKLIPFQLDPHAIDHYFHYQYVPEPGTAVRNVGKLPAAHILTLDLDTWTLQQRRYWNMEESKPVDTDPVKELRTRLDEISDIVIRSDVPVGVALSGGIDSSAVTALAAKKYPGTLHAFSVGYRGTPQTDEREDARLFANYLRIPFHEIELTTEDFVSFFPDLLRLRDDLIADLAGFGYYSIARLAREHNVPVLLQGHGGDELFWGYPWVRQAARKTKIKKNWYENQARWKSLLRESAGLLAGIRQYRSLNVAEPDQLVFYQLVPEFRQAQKRISAYYSRPFREQLGESTASEFFRRPQPWIYPEIAIIEAICSTYLIENGIAQGDRLSMASSVELRLPLLDYRLVETIIGLRKAGSDLDLPPKSWLKAAAEDLLPDWVRSRPKKGFTPPVKQWHRALFENYGHNLESGYLVQAGILKPAAARVLAKGYMSPAPVVPLSYQWLVLELWCRQMSTI